MKSLLNASPIPVALGSALGALVLHPLTMLFSMPGPSSGDAAMWLFGRVLEPSMVPMTLAFAAIGAGFALLLACIQGEAREPRSSGADAPPERICMFCKNMPQKLADGEEYWLPFEQVLYESKRMEFSHGVCPHCYQRHLEPELRKKAAVQQGASGHASPRRLTAQESLPTDTRSDRRRS